MSKPAVKLASLAFEIAADGAVPGEAHLLPVGPFRAADGRPEDCEAWLLDATIAASVIQRLRDRKNDTLIDYEHQSLRAEWNGQPVIAAGWFHDMQWRDGKGLYALGVDWTKTAKQRITDKEYRYISAVFWYYSGTGEVLDVISVALTNTPAIDGLDDLDAGELATLTQRFSLPDPNPEHTDMATQEELAALRVTHANTETALAALTAERDTLKTQLAALTTERDTAIGELAALNKQINDDKAAAEAQQKTDLISAALTDGRLAPALKPWAEKQTIAALTEYFETTGPLPLTKRQAGDEHSTNTAALTAEQKAIAEKMGVSEEDYLATQKKYAR